MTPGIDERADPAGPTLDDAWFRATVERMADFVCAIDAAGVIVYANPAATTWLGLTPDQLVGTNTLDYLHPDDLARAADTLLYGTASKRVEVPVTFRLRGADGWRTFDVRGHGLGTDPAGQTMLIVARESNGSELLDELLDAFADGDDFPHALELIALGLRRQLWGNQAAVLYRDEDRPAVAHTGLSDALLGELLTADMAPWIEAVTTGEHVLHTEPSALDDDLRAAMAASGFACISASPVVESTSGDEACVIVFGPSGMDPTLGMGIALERGKKLLRVAFQQRSNRLALEHSARTDPLTGIANRRRFLHALDEALAAAGSTGPLGVAFLDLDEFKPINDAHGHAAGDLVLAEIGSRLADTIGGDGLVARLGGDEFALLSDAGKIEALCARAEAAIRQPIDTPLGSLRVGVSAGWALTADGDSAGSVLERADAAAYAAKRRQRANPATGH